MSWPHDIEWDITHKNDNGRVAVEWDKVPIVVLMDIRRELKKLNAILHCPNFLSIPFKLDEIKKNTKKPKKKKAKRRDTRHPLA
jgi:hypothetical protein